MLVMLWPNNVSSIHLIKHIVGYNMQSLGPPCLYLERYIGGSTSPSFYANCKVTCKINRGSLQYNSEDRITMLV